MSASLSQESGDDGADIGHLGEFGLIRRVAALLGAPAPPAGPGDDAAVVPAPDGRVVATTDLLVEGRHFRLDAGWSTPEQVGRKAAAANLADVAAMGARPTALLVGLAAPSSLSLDVTDGLVVGLRDEAARGGAVVVGGDVVSQEAGLLLAVTALGDLQGRPPVTRSGACPGNAVVVVGTLGWSGAGLAILNRPDAEVLEAAFPDLVAAHRAPRPPYGAGPELAGAGATSMIDVSDGLAQDLGHVAEASGVAIEVDAAAVRGAAWFTQLAALAARLGTPDAADTWVLTGGEEHSLVATLPASAPLPPGATVVGRVTAGTGVRWAGWPVHGGFDHFRAS